MPINVLIDTLLLFSEQLTWLPLVRAGFLIFLLGFVFFKYSNHARHYSAILLFIGYCLFQLFFVSNPEKSLNVTLKVCLSIGSFAIGYRLFNSTEQLRRLSVSVVWIYFILAINFVLSQVFQLGQSLYSEDSNFRVGNLDDAWNVFTYSVLLAPFVLHFLNDRKTLRWLTYVGSVMNGLLVIISIKRIAILGLITGTAIRWMNGTRLKMILRSLLILLIGVALLLPAFEETIAKRIEARSDRFEAGALEREGRFMESQYVWEEVFSFDNPAKSFLGLEGFYSVGNYAEGRFGERQLHVDYNLIVNTIGIVGLILYLAIFFQLAKKMRRLKRDVSGTGVILHSTFWMLLLNQFITSFAGQMYHISYRLIVFVFMGAILGTLYASTNAGASRLQR
ncbi:MAG: hypothetical protein ACKO5E_10685 [bacterium]